MAEDEKKDEQVREKSREEAIAELRTILVAGMPESPIIGSGEDSEEYTGEVLQVPKGHPHY